MLFQPLSHWNTSKRDTTTVAPLQRVTVWLDELAPAQGTFVHALEWALMLRLPMRGIACPYGKGEPFPQAVVKSCQATCDREGVPWSYGCELVDQKNGTGGVPELQHDFCILGGGLPRARQKYIVQAALASSGVGPLLCPPHWGALRRALVVSEGYSPESGYLDNAAMICRVAGCPASVLTLSHSVDAAGRLQDSAQKVFYGQGVPADFHTVVAGNARGAVAMVAGWRRCSHIFMEKSAPSAWRRWLGLNWTDATNDLIGSFAVLPIPANRSCLSSMISAAGYNGRLPDNVRLEKDSASTRISPVTPG